MRFSVGSAHVGIALVTLGSFVWQFIRFHPHRLGPDAAGSQGTGEDLRSPRRAGRRTPRSRRPSAPAWPSGWRTGRRACSRTRGREAGRSTVSRSSARRRGGVGAPPRKYAHAGCCASKDETLTFSSQAAIDRAGAIEFMCIMSGLLSSLFRYTLLTRPGGRALACEYHEVLGLKDGVPSVPILLVGAVQFLALSVQRHVLEQDLTDGGPLLTIVSSDAVVISIYFYLFAGEVVSRSGVFGIVLGLVGNVVSSSAVAALSIEPVAMALSLVNMLLFATAAILMRLGSKGTSAAASFVIRCQTLSLAAVLGSVVRGGMNGKTGMSCFAVLGCLALLHDVGTFCIAKALAYPLAGLCSAIWGSNAVVVILLNNTALHRFPNDVALSGLCRTVAGIFVCSTCSREPGAVPIKQSGDDEVGGNVALADAIGRGADADVGCPAQSELRAFPQQVSMRRNSWSRSDV
ncbi:unnamed protein product [Prorocentrum cordatum]|uniref:Protein RFT1 homolog n=1 Tax=Prorocentrum cordatum TaxID=2364126 RepID=A0ABN9SX98_9DINO|nr:unnamed protein product [Polarella glacialis]